MAGKDKQQRKPARILNRWATAVNKQITSKNATESPLLRLPPEIRNRIYKHVLGDNTLHMVLKYTGECTYRITHKLCQLEGTHSVEYDRSVRRAARDRPDAISPVTQYQELHDAGGCGINRSRKSNEAAVLSLSLLGSCRQVHKEAALIPFLHNTFTCVGVQVLSKFVTKLFPAQQRALRRVVLCDDVPWQAPVRPLAKLKNLESFECHIELDSSWDLDDLRGWLTANVGNLAVNELSIRLTVLYLERDTTMAEVDANVVELERNIVKRDEGEAAATIESSGR